MGYCFFCLMLVKNRGAGYRTWLYYGFPGTHCPQEPSVHPPPRLQTYSIVCAGHRDASCQALWSVVTGRTGTLAGEWVSVDMSRLRGPCSKSTCPRSTTTCRRPPHHPACRGVHLGIVELLMWPRCAMAAFCILDLQTSSELFFPPALSLPASGWNLPRCCSYCRCQVVAAFAVCRLFIFSLLPSLIHPHPTPSPLPFSACAGSVFIGLYSYKQVSSSKFYHSRTFLSSLVALEGWFSLLSASSSKLF